jgi:hypothetical protein
MGKAKKSVVDQLLPFGPEKNNGMSRSDMRFPGRDFKSGPVECDVAEMPTVWRCLVVSVDDQLCKTTILKIR